jgi:transcriptional regulator with XRE-family HTH domain
MKSPESSRESPAEVGRRIRLRRMQLRKSQTELANQLGVSFQQVQKYEDGSNQVTASRLHRIAQYLDVPVSFFFDSVPGIEGEDQAAVLDFLHTADALRLLQAFAKIEDKETRWAIVSLVESIKR